MAAKNLSYFMRKQEDEIVTVPGPESFKDDDGSVIQFEVRVLPQEQIDKINAMYRKRSMATDKKGNPLVTNGEVVWKTERDNARATRHLMVEALVYPDLKNKDLMDFYKCVDVTEMPYKVFPRADDYEYVLRMVLRVLGIQTDVADQDGSDIDEAKNS
ncbi:MAG: hypothetical protein LUD72_01975 [Bacteroidales bacterium]|nr:hypothetical protein [Bacteroidales bacterium]